MKLIRIYLTILTIIVLTIPGFGQNKDSCDNLRDPEMSCNQTATEQPLAKIMIAGIKLNGENAKIISDSIKSKMTAAGVKICPDSSYYYLEGEVKISPPPQYPYNRCCYKATVKLGAESIFCTIYDLAYFSLDAALLLGTDAKITNKQAAILAKQIVDDFIVHIEERDAIYNKYLTK